MVDIVDSLFYYANAIPSPTTFLGWQYHFHKDILHWHGGREDSLPIGWYDVWQLAVIIAMLAIPFRSQLKRLYFPFVKKQATS